MSAYAFGAVVLLPFPFTNQEQVKRRPAIVISNERYNSVKPDIVVVAITSQIQRAATLGDIIIEDWQSAGLLRASAIKPLFATIETSIVIRSLGILALRDQDVLELLIRSCLGRSGY